jgi:hypothetical protein
MRGEERSGFVKHASGSFQAAMVLLSLSFFGCSDPKRPSEANFSKAVQAYLEKAYPKCILYGNFPAPGADLDFFNRNGRLKALAAAGALKETKTKGRVLYDLTDEARKVYKPDMRQGYKGEKMGGLCFGRAVFEEITRFTEPADMLGVRLSQLTYRFKVLDLPGWAKHPALSEKGEFDELQTWVASEKEPLVAVDAVVLASDGWVHERLLKAP